jgi:hypothetical protein
MKSSWTGRCRKYVPRCEESVSRTYAGPRIRSNEESQPLPFNASPIPSRVCAPHDLRERTERLLSDATSISTEKVASVKGLSSYETTPVIPIADRSKNFCFLFIRVATVQNHVQEGLGFRTED